MNTNSKYSNILSTLKHKIKSSILNILGIDEKAYSIGKFRLSGEIHQWMYDRLSLTILLKKNGFNKIEIRDALTSYLETWPFFELDSKNSNARIPDSLFIEAKK
jgi:hypothetical protein